MKIKAFTLVELVISIVILSVCLTGVMLAFITVSRYSVDPMIQQQAINIGKSYLEEILPKDFPSAVPCTTPAIARNLFANVCDYNTLHNVGAKDQDDVSISGLENYTIDVTIDTANSVLAALNSGSDVIRIDISVSHSALKNVVVLSGYKTKY